MEYYQAFNSITIYPHHLKQNICGSRANYRDGKKETAVKVIILYFLLKLQMESLQLIILCNVCLEPRVLRKSFCSI